jgi:hypothetical protein
LKTALKKDADDDAMDEDIPEALRNLDPHLVEMIQNEIMDRSPKVAWDDIGKKPAGFRTLTNLFQLVLNS